MIATDLCIGCGTGWDEAQSEGSLKVNVWESTDLVTWERTNGDGNGGIEVNQPEDRKSTRLNSSHVAISYAVLCLKKKTAGGAPPWPRSAPGSQRGSTQRPPQT